MAASRAAKRFLIASTFLALVALIGIGVYFAFFKVPETCFDGKRNQNEAGTDCGGVCQSACQEKIVGEALILKEIVFVPAANGNYDVLAQVYNPNQTIGASTFAYVVELRDSAGRVLATRTGKSSILPQEYKYLLELGLPAESSPSTATLQITMPEWTRFSGYREKPAVNIYQKRYSRISSGAGFSEALGLLANESPYDFRSIIVKVILRDVQGRPLAFNQTEMRTVRSQEERDFRLVWPTAFPGDVERLEMEVDADVYNSDNFIRQYLPSGRYQELTPPAAF